MGIFEICPRIDFMKCPIFMIFMNSKINKIDLEALFFWNFQKLNGKNLDIQVKTCFAEENLPQGSTDFTETNF